MKIIVVGAGIIGSSIAFHLAQKGKKVTVVADKNNSNTATSTSFAWINSGPGNKHEYFEFRLRGILDWHRLQVDLNHHLSINWNGSICWSKSTLELQEYVKCLTEWGYPVRIINRKEALALEPRLSLPRSIFAYSEVEGSLCPVTVSNQMLAAAIDIGADVCSDTVIGLDASSGSISSVQTTSGSLSADYVILAAGIESIPIARSLGIELEINGVPGLLAHSKPVKPILNRLVLSPTIHMRQNIDGRIVVGKDFNASEITTNQTNDAHNLLTSAADLINCVNKIPFSHSTLGLRPIPADGHPIIGPVKSINGLYLTVMHSGITLAAIVGRLVAQEITTDINAKILTPYRLDRFD